MSWAEVKKINSDLSKSLDTRIDEFKLSKYSQLYTISKAAASTETPYIDITSPNGGILYLELDNMKFSSFTTQKCILDDTEMSPNFISDFMNVFKVIEGSYEDSSGIYWNTWYNIPFASHIKLWFNKRDNYSGVIRYITRLK